MKLIRIIGVLVIAVMLLVGILAFVANGTGQASEAAAQIGTGWPMVHQVGANTDVDQAAAEDIWDGGGDCSWPTSATTTTIVSASISDTVALTGARTVLVEGVDSSYNRLRETASMSGTNLVTLTNQFLRVNAVDVSTAGSYATNYGNIQVKHSSTVLAQITAGNGKSLKACYTIPNNFDKGFLCGSYANIDGFAAAGTNTAQLALLARVQGGAWIKHDLATVKAGTALWQYDYSPAGCLTFENNTDLRWRATSVSADNTAINAAMDLILVP